MKDKILKEAMEWYDKHDDKNNVLIEDFVDLVIDKTADNLFDEIQSELEEEFKKGNLQHPFIISSDYYLYLKLKEIKDKLVKPKNNSINVEEDSSKKFD
ncbi:hypothetical protein AYK20_09735 [Thermoplasmatales archaeon SG8-52-1]|nr:MAG: hypothetical protein AYK20_09735 [Thermoplasmatales archaeon SG8-52-1]